MSVDFQKHLPTNMQSGLRKGATATNLRRLNRAKRISAGLRAAHYEEFGKRYATMCQKAIVRAERDRIKLERLRSRWASNQD